MFYCLILFNVFFFVYDSLLFLTLSALFSPIISKPYSSQFSSLIQQSSTFSSLSSQSSLFRSGVQGPQGGFSKKNVEMTERGRVRRAGDGGHT